MISEKTKELIEICTKKPADIAEIKSNIQTNNLTTEEITRSAIKLCDKYGCAKMEFIYHNNRQPLPEELPTFRFEEIFDVFIEAGIDINLIICDNGTDNENLIDELQYIDDGYLSARILRKLLTKYGKPDFEIDNHNIAFNVCENFIFDANNRLYSDAMAEDIVFRFILVLLGFGCYDRLRMQNGCKTEILRDFENFSYKVISDDNSVALHITENKTGTLVAII